MAIVGIQMASLTSDTSSCNGYDMYYKFNRKERDFETNQLNTIVKHIFDKPTIILNVGGIKHQISWKKLEKVASSRLYRIRFAENIEEVDQLCDGYDISHNEIFFDRPARYFTSILHFYQTGKLHLMDEGCVLAIHDDLNYWGIDEFYFEECCHFKYYQRKENCLDEMKRNNDEEIEPVQITGVCCVQAKQKVWNYMEHPETSCVAKAIGSISVLFVLVSSITFCLSTIKDYNIKIIKNDRSLTQNTSEEIKYEQGSENPVYETIEIICIIWFTLEFVLRFWSSPNRFTFMRSPLNFIDFISILPYYISLILENDKFKIIFYETNNVRVFRLFRIFRILRIFKLARHSDGLQSFGQTLQKSYNELGLLVMFLSITVLIFSSLAYFAEKDIDNTQFESIPSSFWWAIITLTTVGYGDMHPQTLIGKVIGSICAICGVLVISLPVPIIVNNFTYFYEEQKKKSKSIKMKNEGKQRKAMNQEMEVIHRLSKSSDINRSVVSISSEKIPFNRSPNSDRLIETNV